MAGIRIGGVAFISSGSPPWSMNEGTTPPEDADQSNLWRVINGTGTRLTPFTDPTCASPPCQSDGPYNPRMNGQLVAYAAFNENAESVIEVVAADGSSTFPPTGLFLDPAGWWVNYPNWNTAGNKIVFTWGDGLGTRGGYIYEVTYPGAVDTLLWSPQLQGGTQREAAYRPAYSPDGTQIAFLVNADPGTTCGTDNLDCSRQGLWVMDADGSNDTQIVQFGDGTDSDAGYAFTETQIAWSNDGEWIAYNKLGFDSSAEGDNGIYKIRPDGTDDTLLRQGLSAGGTHNRIGWGAWLPGDNEIIVTSATSLPTGWKIFSLLTDGSETATEIVNSTDGPIGTQNFECAYRHSDNRLYWIGTESPTNLQVRSSEVDGTDLQTVFSAVDSVVTNGTGFEWV